MTERSLVVPSAGAGSGDSPTAVRADRWQRGSRVADRLEWTGLTATGTRPEPELTEVFLAILYLLDWIIKSLLLACLELVFSFFLILRVFAWSR